MEDGVTWGSLGNGVGWIEAIDTKEGWFKTRADYETTFICNNSWRMPPGTRRVVIRLMRNKEIEAIKTIPAVRAVIRFAGDKKFNLPKINDNDRKYLMRIDRDRLLNRVNTNLYADWVPPIMGGGQWSEQ